MAQDTLVQIQNGLLQLQDLGYRDFHAKLMPTIDPKVIIGIRTPILRKYAKELFKNPQIDMEIFIRNLPHTYYEENNLHGLYIDQIKDFDRCVQLLDAFLPYVNNWATCDMMSPKVFAKNKQKLLSRVERWIASDSVYEVRFAIGVYMTHFLEEDFRTEYADRVAAVNSVEYYINMMRAWYFATALAKQYDAILPYLENQCLDQWTHNKTIQKAIESYRILPEQKEYLRSLKRK